MFQWTVCCYYFCKFAYGTTNWKEEYLVEILTAACKKAITEIGESWTSNSGSVNTDSWRNLSEWKFDTHTLRDCPNGEKVGQMDIIPKNGSNIVGQMEKTMTC